MSRPALLLIFFLLLLPLLLLSIYTPIRRRSAPVIIQQRSQAPPPTLQTTSPSLIVSTCMSISLSTNLRLQVLDNGLESCVLLLLCFVLTGVSADLRIADMRRAVWFGGRLFERDRDTAFG